MNNLLSTGDQFLALVKQIVEENIDNENFSVENLADGAGISRSVLHRKLKKLTGRSASEFITDIRLTRAKELLEKDVATVSEIAFRVGFRSPSYFIKVFKKKYKVSPGDFRKGVEGNPIHSMAARKPEILTLAIRRRYRNILKGVGILLMIFIAAGGIYFLLGFKGQTEREKSIAVLPFINDSPEEMEMYFINGTMEAILNNLSKIKDLWVVSRNSVEQYRNNPTPTPEVARELNVNYILEGSGQKLGNNIRLTLQLIDARKDRHIWSEEYDREIEQIESLFEIQSEIALLVAEVINARVTPEEKQHIEKMPTSSRIAYEFYLKGAEELRKYDYTHLMNNKEIVNRAADMFRYALEYDNAFALAYVGLAWVHNYGYYSSHTEDWQDSVIINLERALKYDDQCALAYYTCGNYYMNQGETDKAIESFEKVLEITPNFSDINEGLIALYSINNDYVKALEHGPKTKFINRSVIESHSATFLHTMSQVYLGSGFKEQYEYYVKLILELNGDSAEYYHYLGQGEYWINNDILKAKKLYEKGYEIDSSDIRIYFGLGEVYYRMGQYAESLMFLEKYLGLSEFHDGVSLYGAIMIGFAYWINGNREKAEYYFDLQIEYCNELLPGNQNMQGLMAAIYALKGEKEKAYVHLKELNKMENMNILQMRSLNNSLIYMNLQDDPEFQKIRNEITAKYEAGHERVRQWLEENEML